MEPSAVKSLPDNKRIRGPSLAVLIPRNKGVPFEEGLARANSENRVIASNERVDQILVGYSWRDKDRYKLIIEAFKCWTGTMTAFAAPGEKLGKAIEYTDPVTTYRWIFPVPGEHQDKKDLILIAEHPDYELEIDNIYRIVHAAKVDAVKKFPAEVLRMRKRHCALKEIEKRVGPVSRTCHCDRYHNSRRTANIQDRPSLAFGMLVEAEEQELSVLRFDNRLLVKGTPEQLEAAARLLEKLK